MRLSEYKKGQIDMLVTIFELLFSEMDDEGKKLILDRLNIQEKESGEDATMTTEEILKNEAVEGVICGDNAKLWICNNPPSFIFDRFKDGDNVKLIILPKED